MFSPSHFTHSQHKLACITYTRTPSLYIAISWDKDELLVWLGFSKILWKENRRKLRSCRFLQMLFVFVAGQGENRIGLRVKYGDSARLLSWISGNYFIWGFGIERFCFKSSNLLFILKHFSHACLQLERAGFWAFCSKERNRFSSF